MHITSQNRVHYAQDVNYLQEIGKLKVCWLSVINAAVNVRLKLSFPQTFDFIPYLLSVAANHENYTSLRNGLLMGITDCIIYVGLGKVL